MDKVVSFVSEQSDRMLQLFQQPTLPIKIVSKSGNSYKVDRIALEKLLVDNKSLDGRSIVPISIVGATRTGKSFLLRICLKYLRACYQEKDLENWLDRQDDPNQESFEFKHGIDKPNTSGIDIWKEAFLYDSPNGGEKFAILLIDTQGVFDQNSSAKDNKVIFGTSCLISSVQIYNVKNNINESDFQHLQGFAAYAKMAAEESEKASFQKLLFLVRDAQDVQDKYGFEGGQLLLDERSNASKEHLLGRRQIEAAYESIECFLMMYPGYVVDKRNYDGNTNVLREEVKEQLEALISHVLAPENLIAKTINGKKISAMEFINYLDTYINFFNNDKTPTPENFMEATARANNLNAVMNGFKFYLKLFKEIENVIDSLDQFNQMNRDIIIKVFENFDSETKFGGEDFYEEYRVRLESDIKSIYEPFRKEIEDKLKKDLVLNSEDIENIFEGALKFIIIGIARDIVKGFELIGEAIAAVSKTITKFRENR